MKQGTLIDLTPEERGTPGAIWWSGSWQCRNFDGYYQVREQGRGNWCFIVYAFCERHASIYCVNEIGELVRDDVPIDAKDRISVLGRKYGREHWQH